MSFGAPVRPRPRKRSGRGSVRSGDQHDPPATGGMNDGGARPLVAAGLPIFTIHAYGMNPDDLRKADAIEIRDRARRQAWRRRHAARARRYPNASRRCETLPEGIDQRSASRHPDWTGPDDLEIKIEELREITDWEKPIYVKVGASRPLL